MSTRNLLKSVNIISFFLVLSFTVLAQHRFGVKASGGFSRITDSMKSENATLTTKFIPSSLFGLFYNFQPGKRSMIDAELSFSQIEGKEKLEMDYDYNGWDGSESGHMTSVYYRHISYLSLPVFYGLRFNKLTINAGVQGSYAFSSSGRSKSEATLNGKSYSSDGKTDDINVKKMDFGPKAGIIYNFTEKLAIEGTYYYGLNNIQNGDAPIWKLKVQQATLGIRYTMWIKKNSK